MCVGGGGGGGLSLLHNGKITSDENGAEKSFIFQKCQKQFWVGG